MRSRCLIVLPLLFGLAWLDTPAFATGEVNLSRLTVTATTDFVPIDAATLQKLCGDPEGCEVVLTMRVGNTGLTKTGRFFMPSGSSWFSSEVSVLKTDANAVASEALTLINIPYECRITDEDAPGSDSGLGFALNNDGAADDVVCVAMFAD